MAQSSEAACLLQGGSMYARRLGLETAAETLVFAGFKPGAFSLYWGDEPIAHFDLEGRWQRLFRDGIHYLKGLDTQVSALERKREPSGLVLRRHRLSFAATSDLDASVRAMALELLAGLDAGALRTIEPPPGVKPVAPDELHGILEAIAGWDSAAWFARREAYLATYGPLPFLPLGCDQAVILQATVGPQGCPFGIPEVEEHEIRTPEEFEEHARRVRDFLGRQIVQFKNVFLGGSRVLNRPVGEVAELLERISKVLPIGPGPGRRLATSGEGGETPRLGEIEAFLDDFAAPLPSPDDWQRLRALNLARVHLGIESGDPTVRALYGKSWSDEELRATAADLKAAAIGVGLVVLVGAGSPEEAERQAATIAALIRSLVLGPGDLIGLLDAAELEGDKAVEDRGWTPSEREAQLARLQDQLVGLRRENKVKVARLNLEKQK